MRRLIAMVVLFVLLIAGWGLWWWHADRTLAAALDEVRADGFYFDQDAYNEANDLTPDMVYGGRWDYMLQASTGVNSIALSPRDSNEEWPGVDYDPASPVWRELAEAAVAANGPIFDLAEQMQAADFSGRPTAVDHNGYTALNQIRSLANLLADTALWHHDHRRTAQTLQCWQQMQTLVGELRAGNTVIDLLVAVGVDALATVTIQQAAPTMNVRSTDPEAATVRELIAWLLDDEPWQPAWQRAWQRAARADATFAGTYQDEFHQRHFLTRPALKLDYARHLRWHARSTALFAADNYPSLMAEAEKRDVDFPWDVVPEEDARWQTDVARRVSRPLSEFNWNSTRAQVTHFRGQVDRRTAAIGLALALYRSDHGTVPATLGELVPDYLPFVPTDPYRADGGPLRYGVVSWPDGAPRPMLYSVSEDGEPDIGAALFEAGDIAAVADDWPYQSSHLRPLFGFNYVRSDGDIDQLRDLSMPTLTWPRRGDWSALDDELDEDEIFPPLGYEIDPDTGEEMPVHGPVQDAQWGEFGGYDEFGGF